MPYNVIESIDGCVYSQGIKVSFSGWMVLGSSEWNKTSDELKAYAYQAAKITGWSNNSLIQAVCSAYPFIDKDLAKFIIGTLEELEKKYKLEIIESEKQLPKVILKDKNGIQDIRG